MIFYIIEESTMLSTEDKAEIVGLVAEVLKINGNHIESNVDVEVKKPKSKTWNMSTKKLADGKYRVTIDVDPSEPGEPYVSNRTGKVTSFQLAGGYGMDFDLPFSGPNGNAAKLQLCVHYAATKSK